MSYHLYFFCRSGQQSGATAMARFLAELAGTTDPLLIDRVTGDQVKEVAASHLSTQAEPDGKLLVQFSVGVKYNAETVIAADPDNEHDTWGCDLVADLLPIGEPDWPLITCVWSTLADLWGAVAWDGISGFALNEEAPGLHE